jgi:phosphoglycerate kinase
VIVRAGFDVPLKQGEGGRAEVVDDTRIKDILPTLNHLIKEKAKIVIIAHLGRPKGWDKSMSLEPVALKLGELIRSKIIFLKDDITKQDLSGISRDLSEGTILFLENMRFYSGEETNEEKFVETLASFGDVFVNEAFSVAHREEASTVGIASKLPSYAGISFMKEIEVLGRIIRNPSKPFIFMVGGAKVEDKVEVIEFLSKHVDHVLVGGACANTFLSAMGYEIGKSKFSDVSVAKHILRNYREKIVLPVDVVVADSVEGTARTVLLTQIKPTDMIFDIGPETIRRFSHIIKSATTLVWNGPFGLFEKSKFAAGSKALAQTFASRSKGKAFGVVGGGETVELFDQTKCSEFVDHVSTGGGAMLEFLSGKKLPAIKVLDK